MVKLSQIGKYKVVKKLGSGGFGAVYLCDDPKLGTQVAIKVFQVKDENIAGMATSASQDAGQVLQQRFLSEAKTLETLSSNPYIVNLKDFDELADGTPYYVMPYLPRSLELDIGKDAFTKGKLEDTPKHLHPRKLSSSKTIHIIGQILEGMSDVHRAGLIHRDIKPANILFDNANNVQIVDFGIAKLPDAEHSQSGVGMGSRNYMSPEQRESAKHVSAASDIYSIGVLTYRMLTGQLPVGKYRDAIDYSPEIGSALNSVIETALNQNEHNRYADAQTMLIAFKKAIARIDEGELGQSDDTATVTMLEGQAQIKAELQPLINTIESQLRKHGEITKKDQSVLYALGDIGGLLHSQVEDLIATHREGLSQKDIQLHAFCQWVTGINKLVERGDKVRSTTVDALIDAGKASTGKTTEELRAILNTKLQLLLSKSEKQSLASAKLQAEEKESNTGKKIFLWLVLVSTLGGGGYFGYEYYLENLQKPKKPISRIVSDYGVTFNVSPSDAVITIDGIGDVKANQRNRLKPGVYSVNVSRTGYDSQTFELKVDRSLTKRVSLKRNIEQRYPLVIQVEPSDAVVKILNIKPKYTPGMRLKTGTYRVLVSKPGYFDFTTTVELSQENTTFPVTLRPIPPDEAFVYIETIPAGAKITAKSLDRDEQSVVIYSGDKLSVGQYSFTVSLEGHETQNFSEKLVSTHDFKKIVTLTPIIEPVVTRNSDLLHDQAIPIVRIEPKYPLKAAREGLEGWVRLSYSVNEVGGIEDVQVIESSHSIFEREAMRALSKWKYKPTIVDGKAVRVENLTTELSFQINSP